MKMRFESTNCEGDICIKEINVETWPDAIRPFQEFLQGSGYIITSIDFEDAISNYVPLEYNEDV